MQFMTLDEARNARSSRARVKRQRAQSGRQLAVKCGKTAKAAFVGGVLFVPIGWPQSPVAIRQSTRPS